jgi:hypothetical protein
METDPSDEQLEKARGSIPQNVDRAPEITSGIEAHGGG